MTIWFVSRHHGAKTWASEQGLQIDQHLAHLDTSLVQRDDIVMGTLPVNLAERVCSKGARFFNLSIDLPSHWRGRELSSNELRSCSARLEEFHIVAPTASTNLA